jgi:hypothetical protein
MKMLPVLVGAFLISANAALAAGSGYAGNWPVTVTHSQRSNGTYCLKLTGYGGASLTGGFGNPTDGEFQIIAHTLVATIDVPGGDGEIDYLVFVARATSGSIGEGIFDYANAAENDVGKIAFGAEGGC